MSKGAVSQCVLCMSTKSMYTPLAAAVPLTSNDVGFRLAPTSSPHVQPSGLPGTVATIKFYT